MSKLPKVLYAVQGTGNGHVARAREIIPILQKYGEVDVLLSGDQSEVDLPVEPKFRSKGLTFIYNRKGGISYPKTIFKNNLLSILYELWKLPVKDYDIVVNDFEFLTGWACKLKRKECIGFGHQASFLSSKTPRPAKKDWIGEFILKYYAPCSRYLGFHFDEFDDFIKKPVIRGEIRRAKISDKGHYTVYLPAFGDKEIHRLLSAVPEVRWEVFSKFAKQAYQQDNVYFQPASNHPFIESFVSSHGVFTSAGFETPAEALYMGKKVMVVPIVNQYEQYCNAEAMKAIGVPVLDQIDSSSVEKIRNWVLMGKALNINYPDQTEAIIYEYIFEPFLKARTLRVLPNN